MKRKHTRTEWFYTMVSVTHGLMTVACDDYDLMVADRERALVDPDKSEVGDLTEIETFRAELDL